MSEFEFERPEKITPQDVVDYEIAMLEHCFVRAMAAKHRLDALTKDDLAFLEAFLLHYRVLLEFFSGKAPIDTDMIFEAMEFSGNRPLPEVASVAKQHATELRKRWWKKLNVFLAHPTKLRYTEKRSWPIETMRNEMLKLVAIYQAQMG